MMTMMMMMNKLWVKLPNMDADQCVAERIQRAVGEPELDRVRGRSVLEECRDRPVQTSASAEYHSSTN